MVGTILVLLVTTGLVQLLVQLYAEQLRHPKALFSWMWAFHLLLFGVYYAYAASNSSDSFRYYDDVVNFSLGYSWLDFYGVGTPFIKFLAYPFIQGLGLGYEAMMLLFAFLGFLGIFYFYLFLVEKISFRHRLFGFDFIALLLFLPNIHFWSVSLGKGSTMILGLGLLFYALNDIGRRIVYLALGGLIVFHVRSHVMLVILGSTVIASVFSSKGIKTWQKVVLVSAALAVIVPVLGTFLDYAGLDEADGNAVDDWQQHRSAELGKAGSGVDLNSYSQPMKLFTFLFRPLFVDAPNALGLIVSVENLFYLIIFLKCLTPGFARYLISSSWIVKVSIIVFFGVSIALAQISANTGIAIRQKSQVMYLFLFVFLAYADYAYRTKKKLIIGE